MSKAILVIDANDKMLDILLKNNVKDLCVDIGYDYNMDSAGHYGWNFYRPTLLSFEESLQNKIGISDELSLYDRYKSLSDFDKRKLRRYSCFKAVEDSLSDDFKKRDDIDAIIENIGNKAFSIWLDTEEFGELSCEDIAIKIAYGFEAGNIDNDAFNNLFESCTHDEIMDYLKSDFYDYANNHQNKGDEL